MQHLRVIVLAAGKGTRMFSSKIKVVHEVAGKPVLQYVLDMLNELGVEETFLVLGYQADLVEQSIKSKNLKIVLQKDQLGTGHAVMQTADDFSGLDNGPVIVMAGDCPLIKKNTMQQLLDLHQHTGAAATVLTTEMQDPARYGRILRAKDGSVLAIREAKECSVEELAVKEINTGTYVFQSKDLFRILNSVSCDNSQGEYYLTDVLELLRSEGKIISGFCSPNPDEMNGINTRKDLADVASVVYQEQAEKWMAEGVTLVDPKSTFIDADVRIGQDTIIEPFTILRGSTAIGKSCFIGAGSYLENANIADNESVEARSVVRSL